MRSAQMLIRFAGDVKQLYHLRVASYTLDDHISKTPTIIEHHVSAAMVEASIPGLKRSPAPVEASFRCSKRSDNISKSIISIATAFPLPRWGESGGRYPRRVPSAEASAGTPVIH
jgi:hypothetical protein